jgi:hypothetical protein
VVLDDFGALGALEAEVDGPVAEQVRA